MSGESVRVDVWLWSVRLAKTRTQATVACRAGHVRVNGDHAKAATLVRIGDKVELRGKDWPVAVVVRGLLVKRVGAEPAKAAYDDVSPPKPDATFAGPVAVRERGSGKPTARERRQLARLRGRI